MQSARGLNGFALGAIAIAAVLVLVIVGVFVARSRRNRKDNKLAAVWSTTRSTMPSFANARSMQGTVTSSSNPMFSDGALGIYDNQESEVGMYSQVEGDPSKIEGRVDNFVNTTYDKAAFDDGVGGSTAIYDNAVAGDEFAEDTTAYDPELAEGAVRCLANDLPRTQLTRFPLAWLHRGRGGRRRFFSLN